MVTVAAGVGVLLLVFILSVLFHTTLKMYQKRGQLPPGPTPWFFLGNILQKDVLPLGHSYEKLVKKYGPIFTVWMGPNPMVVLCGYEVVKDALVDHSEEFGGRPDLPTNDRITKGLGIISRDDNKWRELRRFTLSTLRDFGMGKKTMSEKVQEEARFLMEQFAATKGQAFNPTKNMASSVANVICSVILGTRFDDKDPTFVHFVHTMDNFVRFFESFGATVYATLPNIMFYLPGPHKKVMADCEKLCDFIHKVVESHKKTLDPQNPRDYIDCFLLRSVKEQTSNVDMFTAEDLVMSVFNLATAGTVSTSQVLLYSLLMMTRFPQVQAKVQQEIDDVVTGNRYPGMEDRVKMPYTNAVIHEILRYQTGSSENFPRAMTRRTEFRGYTLPQFTAVSPLLLSVLSDPLYWETPDKFNPGHFLNEKGEFRKRDAYLPFSAGKRACPGEALARMELFLFFSTLLQNFTFQEAGVSDERHVHSVWKEFRKTGVYPSIKAIKREI
ncbi:cytochrome P450 2B4-like [Rhineura floridana]|uniref:cytochrome P450 2B4-like n=1 Tax=Rhineura floridana TaxID=261503 RepID=UPI002AC8797F|nr:cytochrome P450 2B4-like [Rhineura floridana]